MSSPQQHTVICGKYVVPSDVNSFRALLMEKLGISSDAAVVLMDLLQHPGAKQLIENIRRMLGESQVAEMFSFLGEARTRFEELYARGLRELRERHIVGEGIDTYLTLCSKVAPRIALAEAEQVEVVAVLESLAWKRKVRKSGAEHVVEVRGTAEVFKLGDNLERFVITKFSVSGTYKLDLGLVSESAQDQNSGTSMIANLTSRIIEPPSRDEIGKALVFVMSHFAFENTVVTVTLPGYNMELRLRDLVRDIYGYVHGNRLVTLPEAVALTILPMLVTHIASENKMYVFSNIYIVSSASASTEVGGTREVPLRQLALGLVVQAMSASEKIVCVEVEKNVDEELSRARNAVAAMDPYAYVVGVSGSVIYVPYRLISRLLSRKIKHMFSTDVDTFARMAGGTPIRIGKTVYYRFDLSMGGVRNGWTLCNRWLSPSQQQQGDIISRIRTELEATQTSA